MITKARYPMTLLLCLLAACTISAQNDNASEGTNAMSAESKLSPQDFEARIAEKGGRVDFVFGDDRPFKQCHASTIVQAGNGDF
ncbi:MAG: hypothetical protein GY851_23160, partial [bacterium]|nr:hypothetical protein [bacterium]